MEGRKIGDQERLTCQNRKVKIRNVANNYEKKHSASPGKNPNLMYAYLRHKYKPKQ